MLKEFLSDFNFSIIPGSEKETTTLGTSSENPLPNGRADRTSPLSILWFHAILLTFWGILYKDLIGHSN